MDFIPPRPPKEKRRHCGVLPPLTSLPRKEEQYRLLCKVQDSKLTDENTYCRHALKTTPVVGKTIKQFNNAIALLSKDPPNTLLDPIQLDRVKKCSRTFSQIIHNCPRYELSLSEIKKSYDNRLNSILQSVELDHRLMQSHDSSHDFSCDKEDLLRQVKCLERDAMELLEENERLEKILSEEREHMRQELPPMIEDTPSNRTDSCEGLVEYSDHVTYLQQQILDHRYEADRSVSKRSDQLPLAVCQKLEQCIRSVELNIQLLNKQNSILLANVQEVEGKLQSYFDILRTPSSDIEKLLTVLQRNASEGL